MAEKIVTWLIYQGKNFKFISGELAKYFDELSRGKFDAPLYLSKYARNDGSATVFKNVENDRSNCDAAIAIITRDKRYASNAGNLWFEIGLWYGSRNPSDLLICVDESIKTIISDLAGTTFKKFKNADELKIHILNHLNNIYDKKYGTPKETHKRNSYPAKQKIQDIFKNKRKLWIEEKSYDCHIAELGFCNFKENSLEFFSEIMRSGNSIIEVDLITLYLYQISLNIENLLYNDQITDFTESNIRENSQIHLGKLLNTISSFKEKIIIQLRRQATNYKKKWDIYDKLEEYINRRLIVAEKLWTEIEIKECNIYDIDILKNKLESFIWFLKDFPAFCIKNNIIFNRSVEIEKMTWIEYLQYINEFIRKLALIFNSINNKYFETCKSTITNGMSSINNPFNLHIGLKDIVPNLPHNKKTNYSSIWPAKGTKD